MGRYIGIDLGTTTSEIAYIKDGKPETIKANKHGIGAIIPSVVTFKDDEIIVGEMAKQRMQYKPELTVQHIKRKMGTDYKVYINDKEYIPEQISAMILKTLKEIAEEELGDIDEAVITVPANFNDAQRAATKKAAEIAGLKVERIINEPTAAALAYGINNMEKEANILVYDLGGGTFDCTILELFDGIMDVKASRGNNNIGGINFDKEIVNYIVDNIYSKYGECEFSQGEMANIEEQAEEAKKNLSISKSAEINLVKLMDNEHIEIELAIDEFKILTQNLIDNTEAIIDDALKASNLKDEEIDIVLAVGGSSRMIAVREMLDRRFNNKIQKGVNQDEAVALGAAVQAAIKSGEISNKDGLIVSDACNYTLGIEIVGGKFSPIIFRDTKLPARKTNRYHTVADNQSIVTISVYQGESEDILEDSLVGRFNLCNIPEGKAGEEAIDITFEYDLNDNIIVTAEIVSTGQKLENIMSTEILSKEEIEQLSVETFGPMGQADQEETWKLSSLYDEVRISVSLAESKVYTVDENIKAEIQDLLADIKEAVNSNDSELLSDLDDRLTDLLFDLDE